MVQEAIQAFGHIVQGVASYESGKYNKKASYAAAVDTEQEGSDQEARIRENARAAIGDQLAAQGSNGFMMGTGSALDTLAQSQVNATMDVLTARRAAAARARAQRTSGDVSLAQGKNAMVQGFFQAGADVAPRADWGGSSGPSKPSGSSSFMGSYGG